MLNVIMTNVIMPNVIMLSVVLPNVVAPSLQLTIIISLTLILTRTNDGRAKT